MLAYDTSKGAVSNMVRAMAMDGGKDMQNDAALARFKDRIPPGRVAAPEDIAFLASGDARFVVGVNLPVDGGLSASNGQPHL